MSKTCPFCATQLAEEATNCPACGQAVPVVAHGGQPAAAPQKTMFGMPAPKLPGKSPAAAPPAGQQPGAGEAKTVFGMAAPKVPGRPGGLPAPAPGPATRPPGVPSSSPTPQSGYAQQQPGQPSPHAAPPLQAPPLQQQGYGQPPGPPQQPPQQGYGQPPGPPQQPPPPGPAQGPGGHPYQPPAHVSAAPPHQGQFGSVDERGMKYLFGIPFSTLRDQDFELKAMKFCGIAMLASIFFPYLTEPKTIWAWSDGMSILSTLIWPIVAGGVYAFLGFSPRGFIDKVPPIVRHWAPFAVSVLSIGLIGFSQFHLVKIRKGVNLEWYQHFYLWGYPVLVFGLMSMLMNPRDMGARLLVVIGAGLCLFYGFDFLIHGAFRFHGAGIFGIIHNILQTLVVVLACASVLFVIKPEHVPALKIFDEFAPFITALFLAWLPLEVLLITLEHLVKIKGGALGDLLMGTHMLIVVSASFGILMLTAPEAYDAVKAKLEGGQQANFPGQQRGGYQPPPGGYQPPPQGGGFPPQQPPPGGGYPQQ